MNILCDSYIADKATVSLGLRPNNQEAGVGDHAGWTDGSDRVDYEMAREYLARRIANPLQVAAELARYRDERAAAGPFNVGAATYFFAGGCFAAKREFEWR
jgi:hypothetical protein